MAKEEKAEDLGIPAAPDQDKPPEGISQEDWDDLSQTEKEGVSDTSDEEDEEDAGPAEDSLTTEQLAEIAAAAEPPAEETPAAPLDVPETELLSFKATVTDSELPPVDTVPDELQDKLDELDEKYEAEEITLAEYNKERDAINRGIILQNIQARDAAKAGLIWEKEQAHFLRSRPVYLEKSLKGSALFGALGEAVKALGADPKYASASGIELLIAADKAVKEAFGMTEATPAKPAEKREEKPAAPLPKHQTLGDVPPAAANSTDGAWAGLDRLSGQAYEDALEKLSPEVRDRYLNSR